MVDGALFDMDEVAPKVQPPVTSQATSLYRKYRPQSFASDDLFGQDHVVQTLRNAIALNRIAHAYLFCGPRGTGKTTTARLMAKAVNCLEPDAYKRPCNECDACIAINANATSDIIEIDAASNRGIDDIRDLRERVKYAPSQLRTKFYIIDEAHQITGAAANAFLKTLEEPPPHTKFILATTDPEELLPTIVSRCQRFDFRRIGLEAMTACLQKVADLESIAIDESALEAIARHATGSLRDGLGILDQVSLYRESGDESESPTVNLELVHRVLGFSRNERVESLVQAIADRNTAAALEAIVDALDSGEDVRQLARQLLSYLRMLMLERAGGSKDADDTARALAAKFDLQELANAAQRLSDLDFKIKHAILPQLPLELAMVDLTTRGSTTSVAPKVQTQAPTPRVERPQTVAQEPQESPSRSRLRDRVRNSDSPAKTPTPTTQPGKELRATTSDPVEAPPVVASNVGNSGGPNLDTLIDLWPRIRADVKAMDRRTEAILQQVDPAHVDGNTVVLATSYDFHRNRMNADDTRQVVEEVISRLTGTKVVVTTVSREEAAQRTPAAQPVQTQTSAPLQSSEPTPDINVEAPLPQEEPAAEPPEDQPETPRKLSDADEMRLRAIRNIFDAEEITD